MQLESGSNPSVKSAKSDFVLNPWKKIPAWALLSLVSNGLLSLMLLMLWLRGNQLPMEKQSNVSATAFAHTEPAKENVAELGERRRLSYEQWVSLLGQEAAVAAQTKPKHLTILAGDSLSLWFPGKLLPSDRTWLNQGISGETSGGLLRRLQLFDETEPETIFVMIGINDLIRGFDDFTILENQRQIIRDLLWVHPHTEVVVQSILPHSGAKATWEGRDRLLKIPNERIRELNRQLAAIADGEGAYFLDLHPLFTDDAGNLRLDLTTDGLHLNEQGYQVWRLALQLFSQQELYTRPSDRWLETPSTETWDGY